MRVIAGQLGGRTLTAPHGMDTRPTTDRVREALFSILGDVRGARVLDLYAGTGALGIEAISRGAATAIFVENDRSALRALRKNVDAFLLIALTHTLPERVARAAPRLLAPIARSTVAPFGPPFDLVFADPPYADVDNALAALELLAPALAPGARIVLEHATRQPPRPTSTFLTERSRTYGDTTLAFFTLAPAPSATADHNDAEPAPGASAPPAVQPDDGHEHGTR
ncbi:MAG: 16S rRNA (guanine(966)-N(2))-methyltransferase RsmD [Polyangiaceae bacterium]